MEAPALTERARVWCKTNPLKATVGVWAAFMAVTISRLARKGMRTSLVLIHARMYAQFAVIGGMAAAGLMTYWTSEPAERRSSVKLRLRQFDPEDDEAPAAGPADGASSDAAAAEQVAAGERA